MASFSLLDYLIFAFYLLATAAIGTMFFKGQRNLDEYFLAGRGMGSVVVAMTVLAALFSGISFLAGPSEGYEHGMAYYLINVAFFISTPLTAIVFIPFYCGSRFFTAYQYLEARFSVTLRTLASASFIARVCLWLAAATYAPALALQQATGMPLWFTILCTGLLTTIYTTLGGMRAVIWTDVMQLVVLFAGQLTVAMLAISRVPGGLAGVIEIADRGGKFDLSFSPDPTVRVTLWTLVIGGAFLTLVQMATDQVSVQRYLSARDIRTARRGLWLKLTFTLPVTIVFYGTGVILYAYYQTKGDPLAAGHIEKADQILPYFVVTELPRGLPGLFIAAIYAASMSTISAGINSLTSASLVDFYQRLSLKPDLSEKNQLRIARILTVIYGLLVIALAFLVQRLGTLIEATNKVIGLVGGPLVGLFLLGMLTRRTTSRGALIGWASGVVIALLTVFRTDVSFLWHSMVGAVSTMVLGYIASLFGPPPESVKLAGLTWSERKKPIQSAGPEAPGVTTAP